MNNLTRWEILQRAECLKKTKYTFLNLKCIFEINMRIFQNKEVEINKTKKLVWGQSFEFTQWGQNKGKAKSERKQKLLRPFKSLSSKEFYIKNIEDKINKRDNSMK